MAERVVEAGTPWHGLRGLVGLSKNQCYTARTTCVAEGLHAAECMANLLLDVNGAGSAGSTGSAGLSVSDRVQAQIRMLADAGTDDDDL